MPDAEPKSSELVVEIYFFPDYVNLRTVQFSSPKLIGFLLERGVRLEERHWQGTLDSVPTRPPVLIRASSMMKCEAAELGRLCSQRGHLLFYDDQLILSDGEYTKEGLLEAAQRFLGSLT